MNKRAFTLIELLAIMTLLGIMVVLVLPQISGSIESRKNTQYNNIISTVKSAAKVYYSENNAVTKVYLSDLVSGGYLSSGLKDPRNGNNIVGCVYISLDIDGYNQYDYVADNSACLSSEPQYTLVIKPQDGTYEGSTENQSFQLYQTETKSIGTPTRDGYQFNKWLLNCEGCTLTNGTFKMGGSNAIIQAQWLQLYTCSKPATVTSYECSSGTLVNGKCDVGAATSNINNGTQSSSFFTVSVSSQCNETAAMSRCSTITCTGNPSVSKNSFAWYFLNNNYCNYYWYNSCTVVWTCTTGTPEGGRCYLPATPISYVCTTGEFNSGTCYLYNQTECLSGWTAS